MSSHSSSPVYLRVASHSQAKYRKSSLNIFDSFLETDFKQNGV